MSRGRDVAEGTFPKGTILFEMTAGSTLEATMMVEDARMDRSLSSEGSGSVRGTGVAVGGEGRTSDGVWVWAVVSRRRKDGRNHLSESFKIEGRESGASTKRRGNGARTLCQSGDRWRGGDGVNLVVRVGGGRDNGGIGVFVGDSSILVR